ncbi:MAG TPA: tetratricopeptide repeat protein [Thermoanaerobaculia bacterium]|nr:tetratricopeptide repeat protein [Thermoanaerobaculia bacterium]
MTDSIGRLLTLSLLSLLPAAPLAATCGGGGGGGQGGGISVPRGPGAGGGRLQAPAPEIYNVPWAAVGPGDAVPPPLGSPKGAAAAPDHVVLFWFPTSMKEAKASELQVSRDLTVLTARCVSLALVKPENAELRGRFPAGGGVAYAVVADAAGKELGRVAGAGKEGLRSSQVEKLVDSTLKGRQAELDHQLDAARDREKQGDAEAAAALYRQVWSARCLFPDSGKKAAKALKKMGRPLPGNAENAAALPAETRGQGLADRADLADRSQATTARIERSMAAGLAAEEAGRYTKARDLYAAAHRIDPADAVPLRYLGELYRHHIGDWAAARLAFGQILAMPADPISRAVALHGMGKMTIHDGDFARGLGMFEESVATYPLALTYRNMAVYWNSAGELAKARGYVAKALAIDPDDAYNQIFAAAFAAEDGRREEALRVASQHEDLLAASYNLAAIYSLAGNRDKALALLHRHFYSYERYRAVRAKEMKEAREDIVFKSVHQDPAFVALTAGATSAEAAAGHPAAGAANPKMPGGTTH